MQRQRDQKGPIEFQEEVDVVTVYAQVINVWTGLIL